jgi:hypothetical protein
MQDIVLSYFKTVKSPWRSTLVEAVQKTRNKILCISPFFTEDAVVSLEDALISNGHKFHPFTIHVLTRIRLDDFWSGASQLEALEHIHSLPNRFQNWQVEIRAEDRIHAKVWIIDSNIAFVGSGNTTRSGLDQNIEYGVAITNTQFVQLIQNDWSPIWNQSQLVTSADLQNMRDLLEVVREDSQIKELQETLRRLREEKALRRNLPKRLGLHNGSTPLTAQNHLIVSQDELIGISDKAYGQIEAQLAPESVFEKDSQPKILYVDAIESIKSTLPENTIQVKTFELIQALSWISPVTESQELLDKPPTGFTYNEFIWRADRNLLYCNAGRKYRRSQAIIKALDSSGKSSWKIELISNSLKELQRKLRDIVNSESYVWLHFDRTNQKLTVSLSIESKTVVGSYDVDITLDDLKWKYLNWEGSQYRFTTRLATLITALIDLKNMRSGEPLDDASKLDLSEVNYRLLLTLSPGQKRPTLQEPFLKIKMEGADLEKAVETIIEGNGKKYLDPLKSKTRSISFNDLVIALQGAPEQIGQWRILLDHDSLTNMDGITNRQIVGLQPEKPPPQKENIPGLIQEWWHMFYQYWD